MGIPSFYRWAVEKYPRTVVQAIEERSPVVNGVRLPIDSSRPNPNGVEFDNLYLDMNGIIHPCFHPEGLPGPETYEQVFVAIFNYIDKIFSIVRPRKLLFLAIDGVAPRAKMNQQRSRRFRAAKDAADEALATDGLEQEQDKSDPLEQPKKLDSNVITPGTEFMALLSTALQYYIHLRMNEDLGWRGIKVILSDANIPGEGEHKIMSYIRLQRNLPGFDPNTRHCLYGLDADLIMLALASHEIHFTILREDVRRTSDKKKKLFRKEKRKRGSKQMEVERFEFFKVWVLRKYLAHAMAIPQSGVKADLERLIDDFVFMCLFVGNDFLPHIPTLEISTGAIDLLMMIYKKEFVQMGGYLTNSFEVNLERVEHFVKVIGSHECAIFTRRRKKIENSWRYRNFSKERPHVEPNTLSGSSRSSLRCITAPVSQDPQNIQNPINYTSNGTDIIVDKIKLGEEGWKERFYAEKFEAKTEDEREQIRKHAVFKYIEGICWVMRYYYEGVCSWQWFYPYHYVPFASDFHGIGQLEIHFTLGEPFKPFDQLMGVLPTARKLMTDISSPILDFYPTDFELDMNGKRFSWQAICKLPFIEESRLLSEIAKVEHTLTDEERRRNSLGLDVLYVHISHPLAEKIIHFCEQKGDYPKLLQAKVEIDPKFSGGMNGYICISDKPAWPAEIYSPIEGLKMIANNQVISVFYKYPAFHPHIPRLPNEVILPEKIFNRWNIKCSYMPAVSSHVFSERPIPNSVSGQHLAKLARGLVAKHILTKRKETLGCTKLGEHEGAVKSKANVRSMKMTQSEGNKNFDNRTKEQNERKGDDVQNSKLEKLESCIIGKQREGGVDHVGANGLGEMKSEVKSKKRKQSEDDGVPSNSIGKFEGSILREQKEGDVVLNNKVEKLKTCIVGGQSERHGDHGAADVSVETKTEGKSRKRKRRSKKRKHSEGDGIAINKVEKLENCIIGQPSVGVGDRTGAEKLKHSEGDGVANNNVEKLESCIPREPSERVGNHTGVDKLKHSEGDGANNNIEKLESCIPREPSERVGNHIGADKLEEAKAEVKSRKRKRRSKKRKPSEDDGVANNDLEKLESCIREPSVGVGDHTGVEKLEEAKTKVKSRKKKQRSKKRKLIEGGDGANNYVEKLESYILKEPSLCFGDHTGVERLEHRESDGVATNNVENLESCIPRESSEGVCVHIGAHKLEEGKAEIKSRKRKRRSRKKKLSEADGVPNTNVENLESCSPRGQSEGVGDHVGEVKLEK